MKFKLITVEEYQNKNPNDERADYEIARELMEKFYKHLGIDATVSEARGLVKDNWKCLRYIYEAGYISPFTIYFHIGIGHVNWNDAIKHPRKYYLNQSELNTIQDIIKCKKIIENEKVKIAIVRLAEKVANKQKLKPSAAEIFSCACREGIETLETDFDNWCDDLDYSNDSIKAREIFDDCREKGNVIKLNIGLENMEYLASLHNYL